jgi:hypothetical protein
MEETIIITCLIVLAIFFFSPYDLTIDEDEL